MCGAFIDERVDIHARPHSRICSVHDTIISAIPCLPERGLRPRGGSSLHARHRACQVRLHTDRPTRVPAKHSAHGLTSHAHKYLHKHASTRAYTHTNTHTHGRMYTCMSPTSLSLVVARDMLNLVVPILLQQSPVRICTYVWLVHRDCVYLPIYLSAFVSAYVWCSG